ncbi:MAG: hypothetical protein ACREL5_07455 [Gemmatimonadales bacterium]
MTPNAKPHEYRLAADLRDRAGGTRSMQWRVRATVFSGRARVVNVGAGGGTGVDFPAGTVPSPPFRVAGGIARYGKVSILYMPTLLRTTVLERVAASIARTR